MSEMPFKVSRLYVHFIKHFLSKCNLKECGNEASTAGATKGWLVRHVSLERAVRTRAPSASLRCKQISLCNNRTQVIM